MTSFIAALDIRILNALYAQRDLHVVAAMIRVSELGSTVSVIGLCVVLALWLGIRRRYEYIAGLFVAVAGSAAVAFALKELVARARPDAYYQAYAETGFSFPSGHATLSMALYGFLMYLAWRMIPSRAWRIASQTFLGILITAISFSRMYLGVHYASDVVAGMVIGGIFAWIGILATRKMEKGVISSSSH